MEGEGAEGVAGTDLCRAGDVRGGGRGGGTSSVVGRGAGGLKLPIFGRGVLGTGGGMSGDSMTGKPPEGGGRDVEKTLSVSEEEPSNEMEALGGRPPGGRGGSSGAISVCLCVCVCV